MLFNFKSLFENSNIGSFIIYLLSHDFFLFSNFLLFFYCTKLEVKIENKMASL